MSINAILNKSLKDVFAIIANEYSGKEFSADDLMKFIADNGSSSDSDSEVKKPQRSKKSKKKPKKTNKMPNRPRKPLNKSFLYRQSLDEEDRKKGVWESMWKDLDESEKNEWKEKWEPLNEQYKKDLEEYKQTDEYKKATSKEDDSDNESESE